MENLKIKNTNTNEILKNLTELGYVWTPDALDSGDCLLKSRWIITESNGEIFYSSKDSFMDEGEFKEITIGELRDMVVLKRNDLKDATHYDSFVTSEVLKCILIFDWWYLFTGGKWQQFCHIDGGRSQYIKPIQKEKTMKEWIYKDGSGEYVLTTDPEVANLAADAVEVPDGAEKYIQGVKHRSRFGFVRGGEFYGNSSKKWLPHGDEPHDYKVVWQREKPQEKCADVCVEAGGNNVQSTLEDRESQYGSFSDVAELTCDLMGDLVRPGMSFVQREALHMICSKLARIRCGDINKIDSWHDIAGYATLVVQDLEKKAVDADKINQSDNRDWVEEIESSKD